MQLIVGLGNPGDQYMMNRHNIGFMAVDALHEEFGSMLWSEKFKGLYSKGSIQSKEVIFLKPQTFMNRSGESVQACMNFFKIPIDDVWVIHDEIELPLGEVKTKQGGSAKGHNGLRSLDQHIGQNYHRIRCGVGRPDHKNVADYVLSNFAKSELADIAGMLQRIVETVLSH